MFASAAWLSFPGNILMLRRTLFGPLLIALATFAVLPSSSARAASEEITIYRDQFGTPHIFAETPEGACFAHGYAQASDRLEELLKQYRRAAGTMSEAFGEEFLHDDYRQRVWRHAAIAKAKYPELSAKSRALIEAYQAGVKLYMAEHPSQVPAWAGEIEPWMCVALSRYIIWGWPEGEAADDLKRIGIEPDPIEYHGSNEWLVAPARTAYDAPIALDRSAPHLVRRLSVLRSAAVRRRDRILGHVHPGHAAAGHGAQQILLDRHDHRRTRHVGRVRRRDQPGQPAAIPLRRQVARHDRSLRDDRSEETTRECRKRRSTSNTRSTAR